MSVEFNETRSAGPGQKKKKAPLLDLVKKTGLAHNDRDASKILIGVAVVLFLAVAFLVYSATTEDIPDRYYSKWSNPDYQGTGEPKIFDQ